MTASITDLARLKTERDEAKLQMEDLISLRAAIVLGGTEADLDAHDARFARAQRRFERACEGIERLRSRLGAGQIPTDSALGEWPAGDAGSRPTRPKTS